MTEELKEKAFNFLEKHTYYDECKGKRYCDLTEMELLVSFAEEVTKELQKELNYTETHCLFHGDCPIQEENVVAKEQVEKMKKCLRELIESMRPIKFEEDRQRAIAKAEAFLKE